MPRPELMPEASASRLIEALGKAASMVEGGAPPCDALAEAASDSGVPPGHLVVLVHAHNVGRATRQREEGTTREEKAASVPLATTAGVKAALYREPEPTVSHDYTEPPHWSRPAPDIVRQQKAASVLLLLTSEPPSVGPDLDDRLARALKQAEGKVDRRARVVARAKTAVALTLAKASSAVDALGLALGNPMGPSPIDIRDNVAMTRGQPGLAALDLVLAVQPGLTKRAAHWPWHPAGPQRSPYRELDVLLKAAADYGAARQLASDLEKEAAERAAIDMAPWARRDPNAEPPGLLDELEAPEKSAGIVGSLADKTMSAGVYNGVTSVANKFKFPDADELAAKRLSQIATPEHEQELRSIRARALLHQMLVEDEVLSGHDPHDVARHYGQLTGYAPNVANQPLMAIPAVRKAVSQGSLDTFDAKELADAESSLRPRPQAPKSGDKGSR